jgi:4-nitrophenyl phosphatase
MENFLLKQKKLFILDMDGTFYLGDRLLEGSLEFLDRLIKSGGDFVFFTNNASKTSWYYKKKLERMGFIVDEKRIITAGDVTIKYLKENFPDSSVYLLGTPHLEESFIKSGIDIYWEEEDDIAEGEADDFPEYTPDIVVVSFDLTLTYEKVSKACRFIREGAMFFATHMDLNCPVEDGFIPDCGSICAMVTASTGVKPRYFGKPFRETVDMISQITGYKKRDMAMVGDRLYTDVAMGVNNGITSVLVLSGETTKEQLKKSDIKPDFVFDSLNDIP